MKTKILALLFTLGIVKPVIKLLILFTAFTTEVKGQNPLFLNSTLNPGTVTWDVSFQYAPTYWALRIKDTTDLNINIDNVYLKKQLIVPAGTPSNVVWVNPTTKKLEVSSISSLTAALTQPSITAGTNISVTGSNPSFTIANTSTLTSLTASTGISVNGSTITNTLPDKTVTISSANSQATITSSYPGFTITPYTTTTFTASRAINGSTFQVSSSRQALVFYTVKISCTASIGSASSGTLALQYSIDNGSTWVDVGQLENSNTVTLAIVLNSVTSQAAQMGGFIPAGAIVRMNQSISETTSITFIRGQETY